MLEEGTGSYAVPSSVKVVVLADMGPGAEVLLGLNDRGSGELPGGLPDTQDETLADTVAREAFEGSGIFIDNDLVLVGGRIFHSGTGAPGDVGPSRSSAGYFRAAATQSGAQERAMG